MVVADTAARGKGVTQPETVIGRYPIGDVGKGRRALVSGDDQVWIGCIPGDDPGRRHDLALGVEIVGQVEQAGQEGLVRPHRLGAHGVDRAAAEQGFRIEAAFGTDRHDDRVLDLLCLDQAQDLGTEIVLAVRPAQAAARHRSEAQVDAFDVRRPDEDFTIGLGLRQIDQFAAGDLEADIGFGLTVHRLEIVGALHGAQHGIQPAQDAVMVETGDLLQQFFDLGGRGFDRFAAAFDRTAGAEPGIEQGDQGFDRFRVFAQRRLLHVRAGIEARLDTITAQRAQQGDLAPRLAGEGQGVETVILGLAVPQGQSRFLEFVVKFGEFADVRRRQLDQELVNPARATLGLDFVAVFLERLQAHIVEHGQDVGQGHGAIGAGIELETEDRRRIVRPLIGAHGDGVIFVQLRQLHRIGHRFGDVITILVTGGQGARPGHPVDARRRQAVTRGKVAILDQGGDLLRPRPRQAFDIGLDLGQVGMQVVARGDTYNIMDTGEQGLADVRVHGADPAAISRGQDLPGRLLHLRLVDFARNVQQHRDETVERIVAREQLDARPVGQVQNAAGDAQQVLFGHLEQFVARIGFKDVFQPLFIIAAGRQAKRLGGLEDAFGLAADQRHFEGRAVIGFGSEQADEADLAGRLAVGAVPLDADIVHVDAAMDARLDIGLGHRDRFGIFQLGQQLLAEHGRLGRAAQDRACGVTQHAEPFLKLVQRLFTRIAAVRVARIGITAGAEKDEVIGVDPAQKGQVLGQDAGVDL